VFSYVIIVNWVHFRALSIFGNGIGPPHMCNLLSDSYSIEIELGTIIRQKYLKASYGNL
jgi:hypothetical protein